MFTMKGTTQYIHMPAFQLIFSWSVVFNLTNHWTSVYVDDKYSVMAGQVYLSIPNGKNVQSVLYGHNVEFG